MPREGQLGPITVREVAKRHGMSMSDAEDVALAAGVNVYEYDFTYMTRSSAERFLAEMYRRRGVNLLKREARRRKS